MGIIEDGVYEIAICDSDLVLDVDKEWKENGTPIIAFLRKGSLNQCFRITNIEDDVYTIVDLNSLKALEMDRQTKKVQIATYNMSDTMKWRFTDVGDNHYKIENVHCGLVLDLDNENWENNTPICGYEWHGGDNQQFRLNKKDMKDINMPNDFDDFDNIMSLLKPKKAEKVPQDVFSNLGLSQGDISNIWGLFTPKKEKKEKNVPAESNVLTQMQVTLENLQKQLDDIKKNQGNEKTVVDDTKLRLKAEMQEELYAHSNETLSYMNSIIESDKNIKAIIAIISAVKSVTQGVNTNVYTSVDNIDEDELAAALEPFTNPRRIKLLKVLIEKELAANEISQVTGLVGGQLYHHLQNLESSKLIERAGDKYKATGKAHAVLYPLFAAIGIMK